MPRDLRGREDEPDEGKESTAEADSLRGEAQNSPATYQAVAAGLMVAAACVAVLAPFGPIIAAILLVIAAVFAILSRSKRRGGSRRQRPRTRRTPPIVKPPRSALAPGRAGWLQPG